MRKLFIFLILLALLGSSFSVLSAQDGEEYTFEASGITVIVPENFSVETSEDDIIYFTDDDTYIFPGWYYPDNLEEEDIDAGDLAGVVESYVSGFDGQEDFDEDNFELFKEDGVEIGQYNFEFIRDDESTFENVILATELSDGTVFYLDVYPTEGDTLDSDGVDAAIAMIATATIEADDEGDEGGDEGSTFEFGDSGISVELPEGWEGEQDDEGVFYLTAENSQIYPDWFTPDLLEERELDINSADELLQYYYEGFDGQVDFDEDELEEIEVDGVELVQYIFEFEPEDGDPYETALIVTELEDGTYFLVNIYPLEGENIDNDDLEAAQLIAASAEIDN